MLFIPSEITNSTGNINSRKTLFRIRKICRPHVALTLPASLYLTMWTAAKAICSRLYPTPTTFPFISLNKTLAEATIQIKKSETVNLLFPGLPIISLRWGWLEDTCLLLIVLDAFGYIYINLRIEVSYIDEVSNGELCLFKEMVKLRTQFHVFCLFYVKAVVPIRKNVHTNE